MAGREIWDNDPEMRDNNEVRRTLLAFLIPIFSLSLICLIYLFKDKNDELLYVGKSKKIKSRVQSYFRNGESLTPRIRLMVKQVSSIEFIVTDTEKEALVLESNLIKTHQPYFNILLIRFYHTPKNKYLKLKFQKLIDFNF